MNISEFLQSRIDAEDFPSAVYAVAEKGEIVAQDALGFAVVEPERIEARIDTIYDLASLTKVLVTGLLFAKLAESGEIELPDKISKYFPEFDRGEKREITIENLLVHTSGFPAWKPFYLNAERALTNAEAVFRALGDLPLENSVNSKVVYGDPNFLLLGFLLEKICGARLDEIADREIFKPLKLKETFFNPRRTLHRKIAASERGNEFEKGICIESDFDVFGYNWRDHQIWGEVHDGNAWFMNGVAGHAGLFSNAEDIFKIAQQFLPRTTTLLKPETCSLFRTNFTKGFNEARSLAFQLAETPDSTASNALAKNSFGHLGFTGTSLWIEPETERVFILLTNRTHARELPFANINSVRRRFHELASQYRERY